jgi:hypothetical protein
LRCWLEDLVFDISLQVYWILLIAKPSKDAICRYLLDMPRIKQVTRYLSLSHELTDFQMARCYPDIWGRTWKQAIMVRQPRLISILK